MKKTPHWYRYSVKRISAHFRTHPHRGLSEKKAKELLFAYGENRITRKKKKTFLALLVSHLSNPLALILVFAGIITVVIGEYLDASVIAVAVFVNVFIGILQEERADKAFEKLNASRGVWSVVLRGGEKKKIPAEKIVPGDVVFLEAGFFVPADVRLVEAHELRVSEAALTGEWVDVEKNAADIDKPAPLTDQANMAWAGTVVTGGSGRGVVVATGMRTRFGRIAASLSDSSLSLTPLQKNMRALARDLTLIIAAAVSIVFLIGFFHAIPAKDLFLIAVAVAVAAIPEGLPAAVTVVLALGMESVLRRGGLVRNLLAAETLGRTTVILTDKTGTLTKAEMRVSEVVPAGRAAREETSPRPTEKDAGDEKSVLAMAMLTSDGFVEGFNRALSEWIVRGRPIERAILLFGLESGLRPEKLSAENGEIDAIPFASSYRFAATLNHFSGGRKKDAARLYFTGAPETLLSHARFFLAGGKKAAMSGSARRAMEKKLEAYASSGMRVIAVAYRDFPPRPFSPNEKKNPLLLLSGEIVFAGLIVIHDPLRPDVPQAIRTARKAGIRVIMVTGDNAATAHRVAVEAGIAREGSRVVVGSEMEDMKDGDLLSALREASIFARVLPEQKLRIVSLLKGRGETVAMTGDGINDAPALRRADIGLALGSGTEVAKEASDIILLNNSFSVITAAVKEGRRIMDNLKKIVAYLLSTSFAEIFVVGAALAFAAPVPLLPAQILWTNIVGEGFMNFAFAFEKAERGIMRRSPRSADSRRILTARLRSLIVIVSVMTGIFLSAFYFLLLKTGLPLADIRTIMFAALSASAILFSLSLKDLHAPLWRIKIFSNAYFLGAFSVSVLLLLAALFFPPLQALLSLSDIRGGHIVAIFIAAAANLALIEVAKHFFFGKVARLSD